MPSLSRQTLSSLALASAAALTSTGASAVTTYTYSYVGNPFSYVGTGSDVSHVSGSFTLSTALPVNTLIGLTASAFADFSFTDGRTTWNKANYAAGAGNIFDVLTNASGNIVGWNIDILNGPAGVAGGGLISTCGACATPSGTTGWIGSDGTNTYFNYDAYNFGSPGAWTESISGVPEPGSYSMFLVGVGLLGLVGWRRRMEAGSLA